MTLALEPAAAADAVAIVIPTVGRPSLRTLLDSLAAAIEFDDAATLAADGGRETLAGAAPFCTRIVVVDDRRDRARALPLEGVPKIVAQRLEVIAGRGAGPASARNVGWRFATDAVGWIAFLDDDVVVDEGWLRALRADLRDLPASVGGSQGRLIVPVPRDRPLTDYERNVRGLETARWITADMAYRRDVLEAVGGFDERFRRAYREDVDLALCVVAAGWRIVDGERLARHPVRPETRWTSVRAQAGNADDVLMRKLHGAGWKAKAGVPTGAFGSHRRTVALAVTALVAMLAGRRRLALIAGLGWLASTLDFAWRRIAPGPRDRREVTTMLVTSVLIPFVAVAHRSAGAVQHRSVAPFAPPAALGSRNGSSGRTAGTISPVTMRRGG